MIIGYMRLRLSPSEAETTLSLLEQQRAEAAILVCKIAAQCQSNLAWADFSTCKEHWGPIHYFCPSCHNHGSGSRWLYLKGNNNLGDIPFLKHDLRRTTMKRPFRSWMLPIVGAEISGTQISEGSADCWSRLGLPKTSEPSLATFGTWQDRPLW